MTIFGFYVPFMWVGGSVFTVGCGLIHTLTATSTPAQWIGYQVIGGVGYGFTTQVPFLAVQNVLSADDIPTGGSLIIFFQCLGGALGVSIAQNIFVNTLLQELQHITGIDAATVISAGATEIPYAVPPNLLGAVLDAYNYALTTAFILAIAAGGTAFLLSFGMEWKKFKNKAT